MNSIRERLEAMADPKYRKFHAKLCPGMTDNLGVRTPRLRALAKEIAKGDFRAYLENATDDSYEETLLQGMVIGYAKMDFEERLSYITAFVPKIDNWATCDLFCSSLTFTKRNQQTVREFLNQYLSSNNEYFLRFGIVMLLDYYITDEWIDNTLQTLEVIRHEGYYVKMATAWAISVCYIRFPEKTETLLRDNTMDDFTHNKAIQKIRESKRVTQAKKDALQKLKRKTVSPSSAVPADR